MIGPLIPYHSWPHGRTARPFMRQTWVEEMQHALDLASTKVLFPILLSRLVCFGIFGENPAFLVFYILYKHLRRA